MTDTRALAEMIARVGLVADSDHGEMRNGVWVNRQHDAIAAAIQHLVSTENAELKRQLAEAQRVIVDAFGAVPTYGARKDAHVIAKAFAATGKE